MSNTEDIRIEIHDDNTGEIILMVDAQPMGKMEMSIAGDILTVYHTEVEPAGQGKGYAGKLLGALVDYARQHTFNVYPICEYVQAQFTRHPDQYADIWLKK